MGGFKAVCTTDLIQGLMMIVAILTVPVLAYAILTFDTSFSSALAAKGVEQPAQFLNFFVNGDGTPVSAVSIISNLAWGLGYFGMPHILVRFMAVKSNAEIKKSRKIAVVWVIISLTASCLIGLIARGYLTAQLDDATSESVFIRTIQQLFSGNGVLIFIGGISFAESLPQLCQQQTVSFSSLRRLFRRIFTKVLLKECKRKEFAFGRQNCSCSCCCNRILHCT